MRTKMLVNVLAFMVVLVGGVAIGNAESMSLGVGTNATPSPSQCGDKTCDGKCHCTKGGGCTCD